MAQVGIVGVINQEREPSEYTDKELARVVLDQTGVLSRRFAAEALLRVAKMGDYGSYPNDLPPEVIGRSLMRLMTNWTPSPEAEVSMETSVVEVIGRLLAGFYDRSVR